MSLMFRLMGALCLPVFLLACKEVSVVDSKDGLPESPAKQAYANTAKQHLSWLADADASKDAAQAASLKDYRLWVYPGRIPSVPGVDLSVSGQSMAQLEKVCGLRPMEGVGDIVVGDEHMALLKKAHEYAQAYNRMVLSYCLK